MLVQYINNMIITWKIEHPEQFTLALLFVAAMFLVFIVALYGNWKNEQACKAAQQAANRFYKEF